MAINWTALAQMGGAALGTAFAGPAGGVAGSALVGAAMPGSGAVASALRAASGGRTYGNRLQQAMSVASSAPPALQRRVFSAAMGHHRRGLSAAELRGFHKVVGLLGRVGLKPSIHRGGRRHR